MTLTENSYAISNAEAMPVVPPSTEIRDRSAPRPLNKRIIHRLLRDYGNFSLAYSTAVQPALEYFGDERGYIAYRRSLGTAFALGDPVCDVTERRRLISEFLERFPKSCFCQVSNPTAIVLSTMDFYINEMGIETHLDLRSYSLAGRQKEWLRYARNWTSRRGYEVRDLTMESFDERQVAYISESWRTTRTIKNREVGFINRPFVEFNETDVRKFFLFNQNGLPEAFVFFDPMYRLDSITGYVTTFKRRLPTTTAYAEPAIMATAIEQFKSEGKQVLNLGISPMFRIEDSVFKANRLLSIALKYYHRSWWVNRFFYRFKTHAKYKQRFRGNENKVYLATNAMFNDVRLFALMRLCGLLGRKSDS